MLRHLSIRDIVLIDRLDVRLEPGLGVLTGETGAGKSILLDSLSLALGSRADAKLIRPGAQTASIAAAFEIYPDHPAHEILTVHAVDAEDGALVLRRVLTADGRGRAFVNDQPVSVNMLRQLGACLVEIQGQHESHGLLDPSTHVALLDAFGAITGRAEAVTSTHAVWMAAAEELAAADEILADARREEAYLRDTVAKLEELAPSAAKRQPLPRAANSFSTPPRSPTPWPLPSGTLVQKTVPRQTCNERYANWRISRTSPVPHW